MRVTPNGYPVTKLGLAFDTGYGENKKVNFIDITIFGKTAEFIAINAEKGMRIAVDGRFQISEYKNKNDVIVKKPEIIADVVQLLEKRKDKPMEKVSYYEEDFGDDDIPF